MRNGSPRRLISNLIGRSEFDNLLGHWGAVTGQPSVFMAEDLLATYPDAKVILHERDVEKWYGGYSRTVIAGSNNPFIPLASLLDPTFIGQMAAQVDFIAKHLFGVPVPRRKGFPGLVNDPDFFAIWRRNARETYRQHNALIKRVAPREKLLMFKLEDGWEPLREFLGRPVPDVPFPRVDETAAVNEKIKLYIAEGYRRTLLGLMKRVAPMLIVLLATLGWWIWRRSL